MVTRFLSRSVRVKQHQQTEQCTCGSRRSSTVAYLDISVLFTLYSQPLSDVISAHGCDFHKHADDTELSQSAPPDEFCSVQTGIQTCIEDVLSWMNSNKLMLNTDKTEVMAVGTSSRLSRVDCNSASIGGSNIPFKTSVKYLGVKIDQILSTRDQISSV